MTQNESALGLRDVLSTRQRQALAAAGGAVLDEWFDTIVEMACDDQSPAETTFAAALPPAYRSQLTTSLARRFHACLTTVLWKLAQPTWLRLACLAEELALHAVVRRAAAELGPSADFGAFEEPAFDDADYEFLFDPRWDGMDVSDVGRALGIGPRGLDACFLVYAGGGYGAVDPYCMDGAPREA